jgi:hypothetical protein
MKEIAVTANFALSEFTSSDTAERLGIANTPDDVAMGNLCNILIPGMQRIRDLLGVPVVVKSGYRGRLLNAAVKGSPSSQHLTGNACDFVAPGFGSPRQVCELLVHQSALIRFDQLICEGSWVHVSFAANRRNQVLTAHFTPGGVTYTQGLA